MTPLERAHATRPEEVERMLEATERPVGAIAEAAGREGAPFLSRLFRRKVNLAPARYRMRIGSLRSVLRHVAAD